MAYLQNYPAPVAKTGQKKCYQRNGNRWVEHPCNDATPAKQDGALRRGVALPNPRFTDNENGTVTDNLTGLIWLKNANAFGTKNWQGALDAANTLASGQHKLSDGSTAGQWRLPNVRELCSLIDYGYHDPALCNTEGTEKWTNGNPFNDVQPNRYWSSSTNSYYAADGWYVNLSNGFVYTNSKKSLINYVWPVRGGQ